MSNPLQLFHSPVREWFESVFPAPTRPQRLGWPAISRGESTLILAPTGTGKTLAAFLWAINRVMFSPIPEKKQRCRVLYISPIKALAVDVERNLQVPIAGIAQAAQRAGTPFHEPAVAIRTGDTPSQERARFLRQSADILISTPESLYLLLTSNARDLLRFVETVIIDEIHAVAPTKRGSHLALSLERLEALCERPLQRIGLSATQRPLDEAAHFLGGAHPAGPTQKSRGEADAEEGILSEFESPTVEPVYRDVTIVDAGEPKRLELRIEAPIEDMAVHPKLLELVRAHTSTIIFVNNRRLAERIAGALNDLAGETLVRAHHGSVAAPQRKEIEDLLKMGALRGLVATSSLELGIDMGAVDLVVLIEAPPSVASGMQRAGRAGHQVGGVSSAVIFPKYRGDLVACAAITRAMQAGQVEAVHYPRNPLDVLAQQIVAMAAMDEWDVQDLFRTVRSAAPFAALTQSVFESVLDMLSGRYPSDEFVELRPRITWDRVARRLTARQGARRVAVINGGTIPDRGLYAVYLLGAERGSRVGELDEEMVFESRRGDAIVLGASTWRIEEITHDRVLVSPAPGEPGKMPFWHGDSAGRPAEFGRRIGAMTRELLEAPRSAALARLMQEHSVDENAAAHLLRYLEEQAAATGRVPSDRDIVIERCRDDTGDWRVCVLSPFGTRVHAPWCMAVTARLRAERGIDAESMWSDDGFVIRLPESEEPLDTGWLVPSPAELKDLVLRQLGSTSLFAAKFREAAARALLLPRRRPGVRTPLWQQRKRAADLLSVASRYSSFPILLETYRECVRDSFDLSAATTILREIRGGTIRLTAIDSAKPSPFASALLFSYIANYIYEGDAPLAERRAQALAIDQSQLEEILGTSDLRELLDRGALEEVERRLQALDPDYQARHADALHDLLLRLGDLTAAEIAARCTDPDAIARLAATRRALPVHIAGQSRFIPIEYAGRYRDALGIALPPGIAHAFLERVERPLAELARRYARTHGPFTTMDLASRYGISPANVEDVLKALHAGGKLLEGEFRPEGSHREWCDPEILQQVRRKTLARLRREVEPAPQHAFARLLCRWQGVTVPRRGATALLDAIEILQGAAVPASELEREILPARVSDYRLGDIDAAMASGEVVWVGRERLGERDGRVALYLASSLGKLLPPETQVELSERATRIVEALERQGASFFAALHQGAGGGYPGDTQDALWELVWAGLITNDTFQPVRSLVHEKEEERPSRRDLREGLPGSPEFLRRLRGRSEHGGVGQGRWSLVRQRAGERVSPTEWSANMAQQLLARNAIVMRETAIAEGVPGGYPTIYPALRKMEESGWIRRGMFVAGLGAAQFAMTSAVDLLRTLRADPERPEAVHLASTDPANPYGAALPWPREEGDTHAMSRSTGASVILVNGQLAAFLRRRNPAIRTWLPENEPERSQVGRELAKKLAEIAIQRQGRRSGLLIGEIDGVPAVSHLLGRFLEEAGFVATAVGFQMRRALKSGDGG